MLCFTILFYIAGIFFLMSDIHIPIIIKFNMYIDSLEYINKSTSHLYLVYF